MTEEIEFILDSTKESMTGSIAHLEKEFTNIRAGKASPAMLGSVFVDYYGSSTPLSQVAKISVPDARTITLQPFEKNMLQTIEKAINSIKQIAHKKGVKLIFSEQENILFNYDEDRILQVLTNLLSNAIKFCPPQNGIIKISFKKSNFYHSIYVEDNGKGIIEEDRAYIFDKFFQSINQNTIKPQGSGFGLAISKQIIEMHKGEIWIEKSNKRGTIFGFKLPFN